jgi:hypothetical protein
LTLEPESYLDQMEERLGWAESDAWLNLLEELAGPAALLEKGLSEADELQRAALRQPRKAVVVGANVPALLATIMLRLRGAEVVTLGRVQQPLFSPSRLKGLPGWKHVWMSPALRQVELVEETGARYVSTSDTSFESAARKFGPFDQIVAASEGESSMLSLTRGLAASGVLLDLTLGDDAIEVWTACSTPGFLVRRQVTLGSAGARRLHEDKATRDLALADALHPGWLSRMRESFAEARQSPVLLQS